MFPPEKLGQIQLLRLHQILWHALRAGIDRVVPVVEQVEFPT
jgi:hypothetical protein